MTTQAHPQILRGLPSLSILHSPDHSPNFLAESTRNNGIWCSVQRAWTSCLYWGSSQDSARMQRTAWRLEKGDIVIDFCLVRVKSKTEIAGRPLELTTKCNQWLQTEHKGLFWSFFNSLVQNLAGLVDSVNEAIANERLLENLLQGGVQVHWSIEDGWGANFPTNTQKFTVTLSL